LFRFDYTFDERTSNDLVYRYTAAPLIDTIFNGGNATVFAYGQTGSGKTFTMGGDLSAAKTDYSHGIYAQTARDIFHRLSLPQYRSSIEIFVTFYEIYCGKVFDLLNNKKRLRVLEDQKGLVQVCDRKEQQVKSVQDVLNIIQSKSIDHLLFFSIYMKLF
jgi:kinesin family protein 2/24